MGSRTRERKESNMESMNTALQQQRLEVEQLRREAAMKRIPVSQAVEDIKRYAMDHMMQDHLIVGFASEKANPFLKRLGLVTFSKSSSRTSESLSISSIESIIPISLSAQATDLLIMAYIRDHNQEDCLLTGFHGKNSNPFREKSSCEVL